MLTVKNQIILGYSGHGFVVAEAALSSGFNLDAYAEEVEIHVNPHKLQYIGFERDLGFFEKNANSVFIHGVGENPIRTKIGKFIRDNGGEFINVIHPKAIISLDVKMGTGNFISAGAILNSLAKLGDDCIINTGAIVEHECQLGDTVHIASRAVLAGNVKVGDRSFIGAGAVVRPGITIGKDVVVGAGAVVVKDIADGLTVVGNPAKPLLK